MQHSGLLERSGRRLFTFATIALLLTGLVGFGGESALAQNAKAAPPPVGPIASSGTATIGNGTTVGSFAQRNLQNVDNPDAYLANIQDLTKGATAIDRPTNPLFSKTNAAKAAQGAKGAKPSLSPAGQATRLEKQPNQYQNFNGTNINSGCPIGCIPPDPDLGVGLSGQVVETGNSFVAVYNAQGTLIKRVSMNAFFGAPLNTFSDLLFDPRVIFDAANNRWIIIADEFVRADGTQFLHIAASTTGDATGPYCEQTIFGGFGNANFLDYPQLGQDARAALITYNSFNLTSGAFNGARAFSVSKAALYSCAGQNFPIFNGGQVGTLAPPNVLDSTPNSYFIQADETGNGNNNVFLFFMTNSGTPSQTFNYQGSVPVNPYNIPPNADQPRTTTLLDTLDARFQNRSTQVGNNLYNVHTVSASFNFGGTAPIPVAYHINTNTNRALSQTYFYASGTSNDWNPSIAANAQNEVFVNWTSDDPTAGVMPSVRVGGSQNDDGIFQGMLMFEGSSVADHARSPDRWGDYSAVALDPRANTGTGCAANRRAWVVNQKVPNVAYWGTHIGKIGYCN